MLQSLNIYLLYCCFSSDINKFHRPRHHHQYPLRRLPPLAPLNPLRRRNCCREFSGITVTIESLCSILIMAQVGRIERRPQLLRQLQRRPTPSVQDVSEAITCILTRWPVWCASTAAPWPAMVDFMAYNNR